MSNSHFQFKQFKINQNNTAMKVGVDAVLLGAWANPAGAAKILDIGSGTGVLSLMMAQKSGERILGLEIDQNAYSQSLENVKLSDWAARIEIVNKSFQDFISECNDEFDYIICNPPYFNSTLISPNEKRTLARHDQSLSLFELFYGVSALLSHSGHFAMIYPYPRKEEVLTEAQKTKLFPIKMLDIRGNEKKLPNRFAVEFCKSASECELSELMIRNSASNEYTDEYKDLTRDFYLNF